MRRRDFVRTSALTLSSSLLSRYLPAQSPTIRVPDPSVRRVLVMFKCHFDAGFIDTQANVVHRYFNEYFPRAIDIAQQSRKPGAQRYVWTTGSWLLYEYLEQASAADRRRMEQAIADGDIAWHAIPFSWQTEMMDPSMISASIALSHALDRRFGQTTTGAKMTDVPGHTRGIIAPIASQGVKFLDIGVNDGCTPADVPPLFVWKDSKASSIVVMYHLGYGGTVHVPGSDLAIAIVVRGDNSGPHPPDEIEETYAGLAYQFPNAKIDASSLAAIANAVEPLRNNLPIVTEEIGDTWIYGIASDPLKVARYREVARLRQSWIASGKFESGDATDRAFLRSVLLEVEHTWGTDTKTWLDFDHLTPHDLSLMIYNKTYEVVEFSWNEKRQDLFDGIDTLPKALRDEARSAVRALAAPAVPHLSSASPHPPEKEIETEHFVLALDPATGAIHRLRNKHNAIEWASASHPLALFSYQTLSPADYTRFFANYTVIKADWLSLDLGKPNIERYGAESREWLPSLMQLDVSRDAQGHRILAHLELRDADATNSGRVAFPEKLILQLSLPSTEPVIHVELSWFQKRPTRMPEAMWLTFSPNVSSKAGWTMDKSGEPVSPFDVVSGGSRHQHAVESIRFQDGNRKFAIECIDAPFIALGKKSPLNFSRAQPDLSSGIHCNLFNNAWGTNYIMWFGEDMRFRYLIRA